jgi:hypothetical protein
MDGEFFVPGVTSADLLPDPLSVATSVALRLNSRFGGTRSSPFPLQRRSKDCVIKLAGMETRRPRWKRRQIVPIASTLNANPENR